MIGLEHFIIEHWHLKWDKTKERVKMVKFLRVQTDH